MHHETIHYAMFLWQESLFARRYYLETSSVAIPNCLYMKWRMQ